MSERRITIKIQGFAPDGAALSCEQRFTVDGQQLAALESDTKNAARVVSMTYLQEFKDYIQKHGAETKAVHP